MRGGGLEARRCRGGFGGDAKASPMVVEERHTTRGFDGAWSDGVQGGFHRATCAGANPDASWLSEESPKEMTSGL